MHDENASPDQNEVTCFTEETAQAFKDLVPVPKQNKFAAGAFGKRQIPIHM